METEQLIGLSRAKKMNDLGKPQISEYYWCVFDEGTKVVTPEPIPADVKGLKDYYAAFSVSELKQWLPSDCDDPRLKEQKNKANNQADIIIELATKGKIKV